jgi:hypothetical protein
MPRYKSKGDFQNQIWENLRGSSKGALGLALQEKLKEKERQKEIQTKLQSVILEAALKNSRLKQGADLSKVDTSGGIQGILGQIPDMFEQTPDYSQMNAGLRTQELARKLENQRKLSVMGGLEAPSETDISAFTPQLQKPILGMGQAEGGEVILPKGARFAEGRMLSPTGEQIGEYMPGYEPKTIGNFPVGQDEIVNAIKQKFAGGISKEELQRKALGMPKFTGRATQGQVASLATKLAQAENPMAGETEIKAKIPVAQAIFSGQAVGTETDTETQTLIEEYQTTTDPDRLKELEDELTSRGVNIQ